MKHLNAAERREAEVAALHLEACALKSSPKADTTAADEGAGEAASYENRRLAALKRYDVLDTSPEECFDRVTRLATRFLDMPLAFVSLIDDDRQWFKSCYGSDLRETPRNISFCAHAIRQQGTFIVEDATKDPQFALNPLVTGDEHIRFYAGAPLKTPDGYPIGALCVLDRAPRRITTQEVEVLEDLADMVVSELELRRGAAERAQVAEVLRVTTRSTQNLVNSITDAIFALDLDLHFTYINDRVTQIFRQQQQDILGQHIYDVLPGLVGTVFEERLEEAVREQAEVQVEAFYDPLNVWADVRVYPYKDGYTVIFQNITERREAQQALESSEERFRQLAENISEVFWILDMSERRVTYVSPAFEHVWGQRCTDLYNTPQLWMASIHPEDRPRIAALYGKGPGATPPSATSGNMLAEDHTATYDEEYRILRPDGSVRWIRDRAFRISDEAGQVVRLVGVAQDITEQKQAEIELRASEQQYRTLVESVSDIVYQTDRDGRWTFLNSAWTETTGYEVADSLGRSFCEFLHPDETFSLCDAEGEPVLEELSRSMPHIDVVARYVSASDEVQWMRVRGQYVRDGEGEITGISGTLTDITDSVHIEAEREARARAEELLQVKTTLLNNMSHELRTPLTGIIGFAEVLGEEVETSHGATFAGRIVGSARRLLGTLESVVDFARLEGSEVTLSMREVPVVPLIEETAALHIQAAESKGLKLSIRHAFPTTSAEEALPAQALLATAPDGTDAVACLDYRAFNRALDNLISNAIKFTDTGEIVVSIDCDQNYVYTRVHDTGIGIGEDFMDSIFEEFRQESIGNSRNFEGCGLGLAIARRLITLMQGTLTCESELGRGTTFTIALPRVHASTHEPTRVHVLQ